MNNTVFSRPKECRIYSGDNELFPLHSFDNGLCLDDRLGVELLEISHSVRFKYRTFRFQNIKTINQRLRITWFFYLKLIHMSHMIWLISQQNRDSFQRHQIKCKLKLDTQQTVTKESVPNCSCYNDESCDNEAWSYWSKCNGQCKQTRFRKSENIRSILFNRSANLWFKAF